jgi:pseudouridine-5'-phosphate glycosidase
MNSLPIRTSPTVQEALHLKKPVLALESTVITHGLPYPENFHTLSMLETIAKDNDVVPATIAVINGECVVGIEGDDLDLLKAILSGRDSQDVKKVSFREIPISIAQKWTGGTTVSATMFIANAVGIKVFATGGIGGVHRGWMQSMDISSDITALASIPVIVVCAGCKAILDVPATLEALETYAIPILGWETDEFPTFYSRQSGLSILRASSIKEICKTYTIQKEVFQVNRGLLIANPIPLESEIPFGEIEPFINEAIIEAQNQGIKGKDLTPFLLSYLARITQGSSIVANLSLLKNNVDLGSKIAKNLI